MSSPVSVVGGRLRPACSAPSRRRRAASLRRASTNRRVATVSATRAGRAGVLGPDPQRFHQRLLQRVLGSVEVFAAADQTREHPRDEGAQRALVQPSVGRRHADQTPDAGADMTSRTSIHSYSGSPPGPGSEET